MLQIEVTDLASKENCTAAYHTWGAAVITELRQGAKEELQVHTGRSSRLLWEKWITLVLVVKSVTLEDTSGTVPPCDG